MMVVQACAELSALVREKLQERRQAIEPGPRALLPSSSGFDSAEEALRQLMVVYRPHLRRRTIERKDLAVMLESATAVASAARQDDLRFIDGLNATFEVWGSDFEMEARASFLAIYRSALDASVNS